MMDLRQLRYFVAVAEELNFTRAAERLHIGQPPLSHAIRVLEEDVGAQLFERTKRWVRLTEAGTLFLQDAYRILAMADQAAETARRAQRGEAGELRIGFTFSTPFTPLFAKVINDYRGAYPAVKLTLFEGATLRQLDGLAQRTLDLGFLRPPELPIPETIELTTLRNDPLLVVLPEHHPLAAKKKVAMKDLAGLPFVMYPRDAGTGIYPLILRLARAAGYTPHIAQEAGEASTIIGLVAAGCGVSLLPASFDRIRMDGVAYRPLADSGAAMTLMLARRAGEKSPLVEAFVRIATSHSRAGGNR
ncbi:MAG: LysR substrate-binding domain-containing protein [Telluria sp.]